MVWLAWQSKGRDTYGLSHFHFVCTNLTHGGRVTVRDLTVEGLEEGGMYKESDDTNSRRIKIRRRRLEVGRGGRAHSDTKRFTIQRIAKAGNVLDFRIQTTSMHCAELWLQR